VASVEIGFKVKTKKEAQDTITSSNKTFFFVKNEITYLIKKTGPVELFSS